MMHATVKIKFTCRFSKFGSVTKVEIKSKRDIDGEVSPDQLRNSSSVKPCAGDRDFCFHRLGQWGSWACGLHCWPQQYQMEGQSGESQNRCKVDKFFSAKSYSWSMHTAEHRTPLTTCPAR